MKKEVHIVRQGVATLPYLDDEVPALYTADNKPYIPAFAVCRVLGLPVDPHIRKWRNMLLQEGQSLYHDAAALARALLQEQGTNPVIDALIINNENSVVDSFVFVK